MKTNEEILRHHLTSEQLEWLGEDARNLNFILDAMSEAQQQVKSVDLADVGECKPTYNDGLRDELTLLKEKRDAALGSTAIRYWEREIKRVKKKLYG